MGEITITGLRGSELRSGWQRLTIPDGTVDLFEAAIQVQLESVGALPRFVDSWHYHVHAGQIHCGTNVLRKPRSAPKAEAQKHRRVAAGSRRTRVISSD